MRTLNVFCILSMALILGGCETARKSWTDVLSKCATTDTIPTKKLLYLSPSNSIGPGSAWKMADDGVYGLRFTLSDAVPDAQQQKALVEQGPPATCEGQSERTWSLK